MKAKEIIKAWKDPWLRDSRCLDSGEIPEHPAGWAGLDDESLADVIGGTDVLEAARTFHGLTLGCCTGNEWCEPLNSQKLFTFGCC